jgi:hypothetical protein
MKRSILKRLEKLEKDSGVNQRHRCALVVHDPEMPQEFDASEIEADCVLILPDNGHRLPGRTVPKGSYEVLYT